MAFSTLTVAASFSFFLCLNFHLDLLQGYTLDCNSTCQKNLQTPLRAICPVNASFNGLHCECDSPLVPKDVDSDGLMECSKPCDPGSFYSNSSRGCVPCPTSTYKPIPGDSFDLCLDCPQDAKEVSNYDTCQCKDPWKIFNHSSGTCICSKNQTIVTLSNPKNNWIGTTLRTEAGFLREPKFDLNLPRNMNEYIFEIPTQLRDIATNLTVNRVFPLKETDEDDLPIFWNNGTASWITNKAITSGRHIFKLEYNNGCGILSEVFIVEIIVFEVSVLNEFNNTQNLRNGRMQSFHWTLEGFNDTENEFQLDFFLIEAGETFPDVYSLGSDENPPLFEWTVPIFYQENDFFLKLSWKVSSFSKSEFYIPDFGSSSGRMIVDSGVIYPFQNITFKARGDLHVVVSNDFLSCTVPGEVSNSSLSTLR